LRRDVRTDGAIAGGSLRPKYGVLADIFGEREEVLPGVMVHVVVTESFSTV
jgi:hypothetical protein